MLLLLNLLVCLAQVPLFEGITLEEFGALGNNNDFTNVKFNRGNVLSYESRLNPNEPPRTNDFQGLQQISPFNGDRAPTRMGYFYVGQSPAGVALTLPAAQTNDSDEVSTSIDNVRITVGCTEETSLLRQIARLPTTQTLQLNYSLGANEPPTDETFLTSDQTFIDFNVIGNPYHDVQFINLTPQLTFEGASVVSATPDPDGLKWRIITSSGQLILLYLERTTGIPPTFLLNLERTALTANRTLTGFLRFASVQVTPIPAFGFSTIDAPTFDPYATAIVAQTRPPSILGMFMLWPNEWLDKVGPQISQRFLREAGRPDCDLAANVLPVLARTDVDRAVGYANQFNFLNVQTTTNTFLSLFNIFAASNLDTAIDTYQATVLTPPPTPATPTAAVAEATLDTFRARIPLSTDIDFGEDQYSWTYLMEGVENDNPLVIFPSWKRLEGGATPSSAYVYFDPIKGPLYAEETTTNTITFETPPLPTYWTDGNLLPPALTFDARQRRLLTQQYILNRLQVLDEGDVVQTGRQLFLLAQTALLAVEVLGRDSSQVQPLVSQVRNTLTTWLTGTTADSFAAIFDSVQFPDPFLLLQSGGICTTAGLGGFNTETASPDDFNALYSNHHIQYGYFLASTAILIQLEDLFRVANPFISQTVLSRGGTAVLMKDLVDMLWRDARNPDKLDPQLPFNRHGNPWEGHSTQNGFLYEVANTGRFQELLGEDFLSWMGVNMYARAILDTPSLAESEKTNFDELERFSRTNLAMTADSGKLVFQDDSWIYPAPFDSNLTVGQVFDTQALATTTFEPGTPCVFLRNP